MKRILITGANSYIGTSFESWVSQWPDEYSVDTLDMIDGTWKERDFSDYDTVFHVAGIAHVDVGKVSEETKALYYKVNRELTIETAMKAKTEGVGQFIFMSSMIVYDGCKEKVINVGTTPQPANYYGDSKWQADKSIQELDSQDFRVVVLRPPMIYGKRCKGNYLELSKLANKLPLFPVVNNKRSMLFIDNLCEFIKLMIDNEEHGVFFPQNDEYTRTSDMVKEIAAVSGHRIFMIPGLSIVIWIIMRIPSKMGHLANKAFGDLTYDMSMSNYEKGNYRIRSLKESIQLTEGGIQ